MKRARPAALAAGFAAALTLTACGVPPSGVIEAGEPASGMSSPSSKTAHPMLFSVYFLHDGKLKSYLRKTVHPGDVAGAVQTLFAGPAPNENATVTTELPLLGLDGELDVRVGSGVVSVRLPKGVPAFTHPAMLQLACTVASVSGSAASLPPAGTVGGASTVPTPAASRVPGHRTVRVLGDGWVKVQTAGSCPAPAQL
ncbi:hypothetical protein [Actinacidiphila sp. bgisy160]|uniref:hypothetical protein n=1 Tax=Actinacidiphila sp. bgisy160 TaxID=3413796 RepID=UPI003D71C514